jgi:osmoprotectant transport system substrate-binding protein
MRNENRWRTLFMLMAAAVLALAIAACGDDEDEGTSDGEEAATGELIEENPENNGVELTIGSKNFTEQIVLGEIYAQALEAAGYDVSTDLNLGSEVIAKKALEAGEISAYPEYTSTALTSFYEVETQDVPSDPVEGHQQALAELEREGLTAFAPTPFESANAVGLLTSTAEELDVETVSDLEGQTEDLVLAGSPECRQRVDCLVGLEEDYGLSFKEFTPVDIELRYPVLDKGDADLSILFTTDPQLADSDKYTILEDDLEVFPPGNVIVLANQEAVDEAGPDFGETVEAVQAPLTDEVIQELDARVDLDKEDAADVAADYLSESGFTE